jgi:TRAP-type C4-dicarboxylate transport system permease small subunit
MKSLLYPARRIDEHAPVDLLYARYPARIRVLVDLMGLTLFLLPMAILVIHLSWPIFIDSFEIAFIILPMLGPVADEMGIDLIRFGVMLCVNMQTSFMHPPFGFALFYLRGIADRPSKDTAHRGSRRRAERRPAGDREPRQGRGEVRREMRDPVA